MIEVDDDLLEVMSYEQLHDLAMKIGLLIDDQPTMMALKTRIKRAAV